MSKRKKNSRRTSEIVTIGLRESVPVVNEESTDLSNAETRSVRSRLWVFGGIAIVLLLGIGVMAKNGWLPATDAMTGKKTGWFGRELPQNATTNWNPLAAPPPTPPASLSREYIYAGSRLLAVEDGVTVITLEGDVAPRSTNGDGILNAADVAQEQNFVAVLQTPAPGSECQRADVATRLPSYGSGGPLTSADYQQVQRYVAVLDPPAPPAGPTICTSEGQSAMMAEENAATGVDPETGISSMSPETAAPSVPRLDTEVRIGTAAGRRGQGVTIPVLMNLQVGEVATTFTLEYDDARFSNPRISLGPGLPSRTILTANTTQPGKIGVVVGTEAASFVGSPAEMAIVLVTFDIRSTAAMGLATIRITDSLVKQGVADRQASLLTTRYTNGDVSITN